MCFLLAAFYARQGTQKRHDNDKMYLDSMSSNQPYRQAFRHAFTILRRAGIRTAFAAAKREMTRQKLARAINRSRVFTIGSVRVPHLDTQKGVAVVQVNSVNGGGALLRIANEGYSLDGKPVPANHPHYGTLQALERVVWAAQPKFGAPQRQLKFGHDR